MSDAAHALLWRVVARRVATAPPACSPPALGWIGFAASSPSLRNGALAYRALGDVGEPYPEWVRALRGKSGVYVIRDASSRDVLYVGMSERNLYDTMTRHLQRWTRWKGFWREQYSRGGQRHDPGTTYARPRVEVAVRLTARDRAADEEARLIRTLAPRDNLLGATPDLEDVPF